MDGVRTILLAGGEGRRMGALGRGRPKPLVPFGGAGRLIDFSLANARRSGAREVLLLSQYEERRLMDDLYATWWSAGFRVHFGPYDEAYRRAFAAGRPVRLPDRTWPPERGTADALIGKSAYVFASGTSEVLVLHADHVYVYDYRRMLRQHRDSGAALTLAYQRIARRYVRLFGEVTFNARGELTAFTEKPDEPRGDLVFAAFCIFDARTLRRYLELLDGTDWQHDISRDVIPAMLAAGEHIRGHRVRGHWEDVGTVARYHAASMALLGARPSLPLGRLPVTVRPQVRRRLLRRRAGIRSAIVCDDLVNRGSLERVVAFPDVRVGDGAVVRRSVLMPGVRIPPGTVVDSAIVLEDGSVQAVAP